MIEAEAHVMVVGALARLARHGGWQRILDGKPLEETADLGDVELLVGAGILRPVGPQRWQPVDLHPWFADPAALAGAMLGRLRRALRHAEGEADTHTGPDRADLDIALDLGRASRSAAHVLAHDLLPLLPGAWEAFASGEGRLLDVGVGTGGVAQVVCGAFPGTTAVGIDVSWSVLELAQAEIDDAGLGGRIELRHESFADLADRDRFHLAWVPQVFLARRDLLRGLRALTTALAPGGWLVLPVADTPAAATALERSAGRYDARLLGGHRWTAVEATTVLDEMGYTGIWTLDSGTQPVVLAQRPPHGAHRS